MTCREKLKIDKPDYVDDKFTGGCNGCPDHYGYLSKPEFCEQNMLIFGRDMVYLSEANCANCWDREIPEEPDYSELSVDGCEGSLECCGIDHENVGQDIDGEPRIGGGRVDAFNAVGNPNVVSSENLRHILDSGSRRKFETGAVRDIQEGKGRCDLMPLDVVADCYLYEFGGEYIPNIVFANIFNFINTGSVNFLYEVLSNTIDDEDTPESSMFSSYPDMFLEVSKHFEDGAKKYGPDNWRRGIPVHCYIDSAVRHYLKFLRGDKDEPHDRAFVWNIMCAIWTCKHKPELNEYFKPIFVTEGVNACKENCDE